MEYKILFSFSLIILYISLQISDSLKDDHVCTQISVCECLFNNGSGINLNGLGLILHTFDNGSQIIFYPCGSISSDKLFYENILFNNTILNNTECMYNESSICLVTESVMNLGTQDELKFNTICSTHEVYLTYEHNEWKTKIMLQCDTSNSPDHELSNINIDNMEMSLILKSPKACLTTQNENVKLSQATLIIIVILVLILIYFIGGMLLLRFMYDARGIEMIPHHLFWIRLFEHIQNFISFCFNGCRPVSGYDEI